MILTIIIAHGQRQSPSTSKFDTTNLVIRVCQGDLPGQKRDPSIDYYPQVCAYTYNNSKLVTYTVVRFELVYQDASIDSTDIGFAEGNRFTPKMQNMINRAGAELKNLFFHNIALVNNKGEKLVIRSLRPLIQ